MGVGFVLEDHSNLPRVPGTVILEEDVAHSETVTGDLKHGTGRNAHIVLTPQPSEDPNDPLNWSTARKLTIMLITGMGTILYGACFGPLLNASLVVIAEDLKVTITDITLLSGYQVLVVGCTAPFVSAFSRKYGKRSLFVLSSVAAVIGNLVGSTSKDYNQLLAARIIQGLSVSTYESLLLVVIGDLFFVHERGIYFSVVSFLLAAVSNLASVVCGPITTNLGWKYLFHISLALSVAQTIAQIFFVPETTYQRDHKYEIDELTTDNFEELAAAEHQHEKTLQASQLENATSRQSAGVPARKTFWQNMKLFDGTYSDENLLALIIAPFAICMNLAVCYVIVVQGWFVGMYVAVAFVLAQIFGYPPYNLNPQSIGYLSLGPFIGGLIAMLLFSGVTDPIMMFMTRKNKGVYEPEYRLLISVLGVASGAGLFGYGYVTQNAGSPYLAATLHGIIIFGVMALIVATSSYALDAYRDMNNEIFIMGMLFKNFLLYGFTYFINNWLATTGPQHVFNVFGATGFGVMVGLPIMYVFGKKYRSFWHRHNLLEQFHIRTHAE
ncbi:MFS general substrate transporter [Hyaloscypha variabilis F]|uniref:MFS general substrate transporter n=1 Tax=Hyaloscypha variabilis (strain UAMH 11265 / GT02V1 / F) TaxID=1149755 RepID=A0A2J6R634_HYAVF|nr:MFS general substrate transporter [Hyaloscypha variabilis F]